jgi:hypothetical protein
MTREYTRRIIDAVDNGLIDCRTALLAALNHMSEDEVRDMAHANEFVDDEDDEDEDDEDVDVVDRDSLDAEHQALHPLPWLVVFADGEVRHFASEDEACAFQRAHRAAAGRDEMTGEAL